MDLFDYAALCSRLEKLRQSDLLLPRVIGRTPLGRAVFALDLGQKRPRSLLIAGIGGDEGTLCDATLRFCETLLRHRREHLPLCGVDIRRALQETGVTVVPCLNPDGLELSAHGLAAAGSLRRFLRPLLSESDTWCANARGVDLRHQFDTGFAAYKETGKQVPCSRGYGGNTPQSEPESRAIGMICRKERFRHVLILQHGEPGLTVYAPPQDTQQALLCGKLLADELHAPLQQAAFPDGGFPFWFAEATHRPAFTVQTGKGACPLPETALFSCLLLSVLL